MIELKNVCKAYRSPLGEKHVLRNVTCTFARGENVGILGPNGAGKSTLMRVIAGVESPDEGEVRHGGRVSWPLGFNGGVNSSLSGEENCRFVARLYNEDIDDVVQFAYEFSELKEYFFAPVRTYSSGMRARLGFGLSMAIDFDVYLVDEVTAVGDKPFQKKCRAAFAERRERASVIMVSHSMSTIRDYCSRYAVLSNGRLKFYASIEKAEKASSRAMEAV